MTERQFYLEVADAVGALEAEHLVICEFGTARAAYDHLVSVGTIIEDDSVLFYQRLPAIYAGANHYGR